MNAEAPKQPIGNVIHVVRDLRNKLETSKNLYSKIDKLQRSPAYMPSKMLHQKEEMVSCEREKIKEMKKKVREDEEKIANAKQIVRKIAEIRQVKRVCRKGDPKTKFLCLFFSAVRRPTIRLTIKNFS